MFSTIRTTSPNFEKMRGKAFWIVGMYALPGPSISPLSETFYGNQHLSLKKRKAPFCLPLISNIWLHLSASSSPFAYHLLHSSQIQYALSFVCLSCGCALFCLFGWMPINSFCAQYPLIQCSFHLSIVST